MRKKIYALLLVAVMSCSVVACGSNGTSDTKETSDVKETIDFENAIEATPKEVFDDVMENQAKAKQNVYKVTGSIDGIKGDYCWIDNLWIYLPADELASLNKGDIITFGGQITEVEEERQTMGAGYNIFINIKFENATRITESGKAVAK